MPLDSPQTLRVRKLSVRMTPDELQQFKGHCAVRLDNPSDYAQPQLSPETRGALVENAGGLVRVSERVGLFGRMLGL